MKIKFFSSTQMPTKSKTRSRTGRSGRGSSIGGALKLGGTAPGGNLLNTESVQLSIVNQRGSSEAETRKLNDQQWFTLLEMLALADQLKNAHPDSQSVGREIKKSRADYDRAMRSFTRFYMAEYGDNPPSKQLEADDQSLASKYVETVIYENDANPGQVKLAKQSGLSQSTWSRAFQRRTFWEEVNKRIDAIWSVHVQVQDNIARILREEDISSQEKQDGKDKIKKPTKWRGLRSNTVEDETLAAIDLKRYENMNKEQMIRLIKKHKPSVKVEELEKFTPSQLLEAIAVLVA